MCVDPATMTFSSFLIGGGGLVKAVGSIFGGNAQADAQQMNADNARAAGYMNENINRNQDRQKMAQQIAVLSARGASIDSGAPLAALKDSARSSELNDLTIRANANNQAQAYEFQSQSTRAQIPFTVAGDILDTGSKLASLGKV